MWLVDVSCSVSLAELSMNEIEDDIIMWNKLAEDTHHIEVNYVTKENKEILTQVYFPFDSSVSSMTYSTTSFNALDC